MSIYCLFECGIKLDLIRKNLVHIYNTHDFVLYISKAKQSLTSMPYGFALIWFAVALMESDLSDVSHYHNTSQCRNRRIYRYVVNYMYLKGRNMR